MVFGKRRSGRERRGHGTSVAKAFHVMRAILPFFVVLLGCGQDEPLSSQSPLTAPDRGAGEALVGLRGERAIHARVLAAPHGADPDRVVALRIDGFPELDGVEALDAAFVADGVAVIGRDHVLRFFPQSGAAPIALDDSVDPPLASNDQLLAYARGSMPFYAIVRADPRTGETRAITDADRSCWSPAIAPDGSLAYACTADGAPALFVHDGQERALPTERFPTSPLAPRFDGVRLGFTDEAGAVVIDTRTGALLAVDDAAGALFELDEGFAVTDVDGSLRVLEVAR